jgi:hypothetical protein
VEELCVAIPEGVTVSDTIADTITSLQSFLPLVFARNLQTSPKLAS